MLVLLAGCGSDSPPTPDEPPVPELPETPPPTPRPARGLRLEAPTVEAGYDASVLIAAVEGRTAGLRRCFVNLSVHDNVPPDRVVVSFRVLPDGTIVEARALVGGTYGDCVAEEVQRLHLAEGPDEPVVVLYPMIFEPEP